MNPLPLASLGAALALTAAALAGDAETAYTTPETPGLQVGEQAPEATLTTIDGEEVTLASLYEDQPLILTFYRGKWCPFCTRDLETWRNHLDDVEETGARFVAVTFEKPEHITAVKKSHDLPYDVLADTTGDTARALKVLFYVDENVRDTYKNKYGLDLEQLNATGDWALPAPATYVFDTDGTIRHVFADWDYSKRADAEEVLAAVRTISE